MTVCFPGQCLLTTVFVVLGRRFWPAWWSDSRRHCFIAGATVPGLWRRSIAAAARFVWVDCEEARDEETGWGRQQCWRECVMSVRTGCSWLLNLISRNMENAGQPVVGCKLTYTENLLTKQWGVHSVVKVRQDFQDCLVSSRACDCKSVPGGYVLIWVPDIFVGLLVSRALLCWSWCIFSKQFWIYCVKIEYIFWHPSSKCQYAFCSIWEVLLDFKLLCSNVD